MSIYNIIRLRDPNALCQKNKEYSKLCADGYYIPMFLLYVSLLPISLHTGEHILPPVYLQNEHHIRVPAM